ncbi:hypothetical protein Tsubulata_048352, partial [Turnera subulata]
MRPVCCGYRSKQRGVIVVLTARDEKRGTEAVEKLKESGVSDVVFHQLDVTDPASVASLANFIRTKYGKLDILVNNAGIGGSTIDSDALAACKISGTQEDLENVWKKVTIETYELAEECLYTNYYGAKRTAEALIPLLQLSDSPRIVNVSSFTSMLQNIPNEWANRVLSDVESLTEERIDEILSVFLKDFKEGSLESKGWPTFLSAYTLSKVAMNAHTRILAKKYPGFCINCVCPGFVKTDMNNNTGTLSIEEAAVYPVKLAMLPHGGPSGLFFALDTVCGCHRSKQGDWLASNGVVVILTARDEKKGLEAVEKLKGSGLSDHVVFHQLDVAESASIVSLADYIRTQFGKLDILERLINWEEVVTETYELAEECLKINYYGAKRMADALFSLLQLSDSPRIVNVSSYRGQLEVSNEWAKGVLGDLENLTEESIDQVLIQFLRDFKEGLLHTKGWPQFLSANTLSKAAMNAYMRILAKKYPNFCINCVCPGFVKTDINLNTGIYSVEEGAQGPVRYAVVTGANKGIGFEICRQLASKGIVVVLTARDEKRGLEAAQKLKESGLSAEVVVFHQLDVADSTSIASVADFIKTQFGKLDILVNNAGVIGVKVDGDELNKEGVQINWHEYTTQPIELAEECLKINYYGAKKVAEALIPLLQLSDSPRIVNVSSGLGKLEHLRNEWAKGVLGDAKNLTEERVDEVLSQFLQDFKEGSLEAKSWPLRISAYILSKAAMNAYTRILAKKYPNICINCVTPGYVCTELNFRRGILSVEEGAEGPVMLALLPNGSPSGRCAVVTGANKGIGFEICRQLASKGVLVVLTARDEKRGLEAVQKLKESGLSELVVFHQLDVSDTTSIAYLADFIKTQLGKLDILVNNAGVLGVKVDVDALNKESGEVNWLEYTTQPIELAEECLKTNYYGAKKVAEALIPFLQLSDSPRIVNVSSVLGKLKKVSNEWAKGVLGDAENLTEERVDEVLGEFLKDFKEGSLEANGWPAMVSAYILSKAALNAYTRILAKKYPDICINCVCPGYVCRNKKLLSALVHCFLHYVVM